MLVSLGAFCRTAYQINTYVRDAGGQRTSYPFDWAVTSIAALQRVLDPGFDPDKVLVPDDLTISPMRSVADRYSGVIHHHGLALASVSEYFEGRPVDSLSDADLIALAGSPELERTRDRFRATYRHLLKLREADGPIGFIRWSRQVPRDRWLYVDQTTEGLAESIAKFLGHDRFRLLMVQLKKQRAERDGSVADDDVIVSWRAVGPHFETTLVEFDEPGRKANFAGDGRSWQPLIRRFVGEAGIAA